MDLTTSKCHFTVFLCLVLLGATNASGILNGSVETGRQAVGVVTDGDGAMGSAVLIDPSWVLTSAAYASEYTEGWFLVGLDWAAPDASHAFSANFPHHSYDPDSGDFNIALIRLATPVTGVEPIPWLTNGNALQSGTTVQYVGYGMTSPSDPTNTIRRSCDTPVEVLQQYVFFTLYDGAGPYFGDSGGPALLSDNGALRVAGLISHIIDDGTGYTAATRVSEFATFISATIDANSTSAMEMESPAARHLWAYPNPFNPRTTIWFTVDEPQQARVAVYDLLGRRIRVLHDGLAVGEQTIDWNGRDASGRAVSSGSYFVRLNGGRLDEVHEIILVR